MHGKSLLFTLFFILYYFQWHCNSWTSCALHPMENLVEIFFLFWLSVYTQKINVIQSFHKEIYVITESCNLQCNWLKAILAITQEQEFPQIWDLYSKIDNNFYLSKFPAKIKGKKFFKNKGKTLFWGHFWAYFVVFAQTEFHLKNLAEYNCSGPPAFICQRYRVDWPSKQKLFHHYQQANIIQSICSIHQINYEIHLIYESRNL